MQFTVPQFIDVEDKIIGPITSQQFIIILVYGVFCGISYKIFDFTLFLIVALFLFAFFGTLAFARINDRPFHYFILNLIQTFKKPRLRVWNKTWTYSADGIVENAMPKIEEHVVIQKMNVSNSRLTELSLLVDTGGAYEDQKNIK